MYWTIPEESRVYPIFKLLNSTNAAYDNYKIYDRKSSILWFPGITTNKKWQPAENRAHELFVILHGK